MDGSLGRKQKIMAVSAEAKYDGQFLQEAKISGLVYTLCFRTCTDGAKDFSLNGTYHD